MSENRTTETVRAELRLVRKRINAFQTLVSQSEHMDMGVRYFTDVVDKITPDGLRGTFSDTTSAFQVADALGGVQDFLRRSPDLVWCLQSLSSGTQGLLRELYEQEDNLEQELAALQPPLEPEAVGLVERVAQAAQNALSFGHPA